MGGVDSDTLAGGKGSDTVSYADASGAVTGTCLPVGNKWQQLEGGRSRVAE